ncbi:MAG TPA: L-seryl-tRNA(Sec) selenium transferase, partial [Bryobacteraceae bacterium]
MSREQYRALPSVDDVAVALRGRFPHGLIVEEARRVLGECREQIRKGDSVDDPVRLVETALTALHEPSLKRVINATGVILHTNLGRAPVTGHELLGGYTNLEYDLAAGRRGKRDVHLAMLLKRLLGRDAIVVNNNAAATYLVLNELALNQEVVVSRGELIEIGDGFRIPDILVRSGAVLREVGTTNRTRVEDYAAAIGERTRLLMRVHPSNFHVSGFTSKPSLEELAALAKSRGCWLYEDLGSGCLVDLRPYGIDEPLATASLAAGANVISFSGDKLLGGPQAGIIAGDAELIARVRRNPMFRALRVDKVILQLLEATLRYILFEEWDRIPALAMIRTSSDDLRTRAERFAAKIEGARVIPGESVAGGGSTPDQTLPAWLIVLPGSAAALERRLRANDPPVVARIEQDSVLLDL